MSRTKLKNYKNKKLYSQDKKKLNTMGVNKKLNRISEKTRKPARIQSVNC